jgi:chromosome segregation ATPase
MQVLATGGSAMCTRNRKGLLIGLLLVLMTVPGFTQRRAAGSAPQSKATNVETVVVDSGVDSGTIRESENQRQSQADVEMLARAENRADALRDQLANLQMREIELQARIDELDYRMKPESIQQVLAFVGSVRPMDELRSNLRGRLEREKSRLNAQLDLLATTRVKLEGAIRDADAECERLRQRIARGNGGTL